MIYAAGAVFAVCAAFGWALLGVLVADIAAKGQVPS